MFFLGGCFLSVANAKTPPNFVFVLTDDQDLLLDSLKPMEKTLKLVANRGITFNNAFVNSPICCPSRSVILTGRYAHNVGVRNNSVNGNCSSSDWQKNFEPFSIASILKSEANYTTFYGGKYLNQYGTKKSGGVRHVPKGYDWWLGLKGNSKYYNYSVSVNGTAEFFADSYFTDKITAYALDFLNQKHIVHQQFFMTLAPPACHAPFTPAPRHRNRFPDVKAVRSPSFNFSSTDKHWVVEMPPKHLPTQVDILDEMQRNRLRTLLAVDEMVAKIVTKLKKIGVVDNTYIIFSSDNGFHIGQFTQPWDKRQPYDTDIRVPFMMRGPKIRKKTNTDYPISSVDLAPTILELAGVPPLKNHDGTSFVQQLFSNPQSYRKVIFIEYWGEGSPKSVDSTCGFPPNVDTLAGCTRDNWCKCQDSKNNTYSCLLEMSDDQRIKFCRFENGFTEIYNLIADPYELKNIFSDFRREQILYYERVLRNFGLCQARHCRNLINKLRF